MQKSHEAVSLITELRSEIASIDSGLTLRAQLRLLYLLDRRRAFFSRRDDILKGGDAP